MNKKCTCKPPDGMSMVRTKDPNCPIHSRGGNKKPTVAKTEKQHSFRLFTDGSVEPNPGTGGWAYILLDHDREIGSGKGAEPDTTNNRMEITAILNGITSITHNGDLTVYTDSEYSINVLNNSLDVYPKKNWTLTYQGETTPVKNQDLLKQYKGIKGNRSIYLRYIKAHSGNEYNERVNEMANEARMELFREINSIYIPSY